MPVPMTFIYGPRIRLPPSAILIPSNKRLTCSARRRQRPVVRAGFCWDRRHQPETLQPDQGRTVRLASSGRGGACALAQREIARSPFCVGKCVSGARKRRRRDRRAGARREYGAPNSDEGWRRLARAYEKQNRLAEAEVAYKKAIEANPYNWSTIELIRHFLLRPRPVMPKPPQPSTGHQT